MSNHSCKLGGIVEGGSEFAAYQTLFAATGSSGLHIPLVNARGIGNSIKQMDRQLNSLLQAHRPETIIYSVDLKDALEQNLATSCEDLRVKLESLYEAWSQGEGSSPNFNPLPTRFVPIIQIPKFESWILANIQKVHEDGMFEGDCPDYDSVDALENDPERVLADLLPSGTKIKGAAAKKYFKNADIQTMRNKSNSFDKFFREVSAALGE